MRLPVAASLALALLAPARAMGAGVVIGQAGETVTVSVARVALATSPARSTLWAQVSVAGASGGFVWIVPVRPGARIDLASDAWLDGLDAATAPVVLPPSAQTACDAGLAPEIVPPATSPRTTRPGTTGLFTDAGALGAFVSAAGYALPPAVSSELEPLLASGVTVVALTYGSALLPTRTVRVVESGPPSLPFGLTGPSASDTPVTAFVIASAAAAAGTAPLALDPSSILWEGNASSTYVTARAALLAEWQGARWLTESAFPDLPFDGAPIGPGAALPSVLGQFFALASTYGDLTGDPAACTAAAHASRGEPGSYATTCPAGAIGIVPGPDPCPQDDGGVPVDALLCGGSSDDAAVAMAALQGTDVWVTRIAGVVTTHGASDVPLSVVPAAPSSPVVNAGGFASVCEPPALVAWPPSLSSVPPTSNQPAPSSSQTGTSPSPASQIGQAAAEGCGQGAADGCGGGDSSGDAGDDAGGCGSADPSGGGDCAAAGRTGQRRRDNRRSPVSRVALLLAAWTAVARRRGTRIGPPARRAW